VEACYIIILFCRIVHCIVVFVCDQHVPTQPFHTCIVSLMQRACIRHWFATHVGTVLMTATKSTAVSILLNLLNLLHL